MNSKFITVAIVMGGMGVLGAFSHWIVAPLEMEFRATRQGWQVESPGAALGQGMSAALLGGFRPLMADFLWLRVNVLWEERQPAATLAHLHLVAAVDPRPLVFWLNGARMIGYDMPSWRIAALGGPGAVPAAVQKRIEAEQTRLALAWLDEALKFHPLAPALFIERANICLNRQHDLAAAAADYRRAAEQPDAPHYAARLHAELLRRLGRNAEALAWLVQLHPKLPRDDEAAAAGLVLARIRDLETELGVPEGPALSIAAAVRSGLTGGDGRSRPSGQTREIFEAEWTGGPPVPANDGQDGFNTEGSTFDTLRAPICFDQR